MSSSQQPTESTPSSTPETAAPPSENDGTGSLGKGEEPTEDEEDDDINKPTDDPYGYVPVGDPDDVPCLIKT